MNHIRKLILMLFAIYFYTTAYCQTQIIITSRVQIVPEGKKWILPTNKEILVEFSEESLRSGTRCHTDLFSNPRILTSIILGEIGNPKMIYSIIFNSLEKVHYTNNVTYKITPVSIVNQDFNIRDIAKASNETIGDKEIAFYPGQKIYASSCLESIQVFEYDYKIESISQPSTYSDNRSSYGSGSGLSQQLYSLANRKLINSFPDLQSVGETGKVVVKICVNSKGHVTSAKAGARGTTTSSSLLFKLAEQYALKLQFNEVDSIIEQNGTATFIFTDN